MRKLHLSISIFLAAMSLLILLALAACSSPTLTEPPNISDQEGVTSPMTDTETMTETGTITGTGSVTGADSITDTEVTTITQEDVSGSSASGATSEITSTETMTETEVIPPTGFVASDRASNLLEFGVWSQTDVQVGEVEDIILNLDLGHAQYVVVNTGQFLEGGAKLIPVPWEALTVTTATPDSISHGGPQNDFVLRVDQSMFLDAPGIYFSIIPTAGKGVESWDSSISNYWKLNLGLVLTSEFLDSELQVLGNVGKLPVEDLILDVETGAINYVMLSLSTESVNARKVLVPLKALGWDADNATFILTTDMQTLQEAPSFLPGDSPNTQQPDWDEEIRNFWEDYFTPEGAPEPQPTATPTP